MISRLGRGYSFEALRAKILFTEGAHKVIKPKPKFERRQDLSTIGYGLYTGKSPSTSQEKKPKNYGADISTLIRMVENGGVVSPFQS